MKDLQIQVGLLQLQQYIEYLPLYLFLFNFRGSKTFEVSKFLELEIHETEAQKSKFVLAQVLRQRGIKLSTNLILLLCPNCSKVF